MIDPRQQTNEALHLQPEWCPVILASIGDAVVTTDINGGVTFLNPVAQTLTGWTLEDATGQPLDSVFRIINEESRWPVESPTIRALREGAVIGLANHTLLIAKDGTERPIDESAAPIRNDKGEVAGVVLVFRDITERRRHEQHVQDALAYADNIIATMREPFAVLDKSLRVKTANRSFYRNFHVTQEETEGRFLYDLGDGQWDIPRLRTLLEGVLSNSHSIHDFDVEHDFPAIGKKIMLLNARRFESVDSQPGLILLAIEDVTERKRAEEGLRQSEQRQRFVLDSMPQKIFTAKPNGDVNYFNQQWTKYTGLSFEQIRDWGWTQFIHPDDVAENVRVWKHSIGTGEPFQFEHRFRRADGEYRWHVSRALPMRDDSGRVVMWVGSNTDVHDIKQAEAALQDSEVRYRRLFETAKDGILILDANTLRITDANPYMTELLGYTHDEFLGNELWEMGFFGDKRASQAVYQELQTKGYIRYDHLPLETKKGEKAEVEFVSNVYQVDHTLVAQCNIRDISERSRLEKQITEQAAALSDLHRRKDEFLAMLSHELRNPLAPISNAVHLLRLQKVENSIQQQARGIIERQVGQLSHLVDDLLEISRITTGRVQLREERVAVTGIVECAVESVRPLIDQHKHELTVSLPPQPIWLYADAARLEQVVVNLLNNAAKYTDEGGHVWLTVQQEDDACVLRVRDTGIGIAPELLPRIFDLFTQAGRSLARSQGGLGIGLCLVHRLVEMHRGTVMAYSALGQGSEFVVRLPTAVSPASQPPSPPKETAEPTGASLRVLVVDDNVDAAQSLAMLLKISGHQVCMAHTGPTALEAALDYRPNVVLLDIGLPGMDGYEVAKRIRQQPVLQNVVLVAMTGYGQDTDRQRSQEVGFNAHLVKPFDFGKVQETLATVMEKAT